MLYLYLLHWSHIPKGKLRTLEKVIPPEEWRGVLLPTQEDSAGFSDKSL